MRLGCIGSAWTIRPELCLISFVYAVCPCYAQADAVFGKNRWDGAEWQTTEAKSKFQRMMVSHCGYQCLVYLQQTRLSQALQIAGQHAACLHSLSEGCLGSAMDTRSSEVMPAVHNRDGDAGPQTDTFFHMRLCSLESHTSRVATWFRSFAWGASAGKNHSKSSLTEREAQPPPVWEIASRSCTPLLTAIFVHARWLASNRSIGVLG